MYSEVFLLLQLEIVSPSPVGHWLYSRQPLKTWGGLCSQPGGQALVQGLKVTLVCMWRSLVSLEPNCNAWSLSCCSVVFLEDWTLTQGEALGPVWDGTGRWSGCLGLQSPDRSLWWTSRARNLSTRWRAPSSGCPAAVTTCGGRIKWG